MEAIFGDTILTKQGPKPTKDALAGKKYVLLYFAGHGIQQCRDYTPKLAAIYNKHAEAKSFEVVLVSVDKDPNDYVEGLNAMPWSAIPFDKQDVARGACRKFQLETIPHVVVVDVATGETVTARGHQKSLEDPDLADFPWPKPAWRQILGDSFKKKDGTLVRHESLGRTVGLYFSAHWCPPCRNFTPKLAKFYADYKKFAPDFEIIFVSSDRDEKSMQEYFAIHGDYLSVPFGDERIQLLNEHCDVQGIPKLCIVETATGRIVQGDAVGMVHQGVSHVVDNGWEDPPVLDLAASPEGHGTSINDTLSVVVRCEACDDDEQKAIKKALEEVSKEHLEAAKAKGTPPAVLFFVSTRPGGAGDQLAGLTSKEGSARCKAPDNNPLLLVFDIPDSGAFYESPTTEISSEIVRQFVSDVQGKKAKRLQLSK